MPIATELRVAEASTDYVCITTKKTQVRIEPGCWQSGGLQASIPFLFYAPPGSKKQGFVNQLYSLLGVQEVLPSLVARRRRAKITQNSEQREGLALKAPPVSREVLPFPWDTTRRGSVCFCRRIAFFQKQLFFSGPHRTCLFEAIKPIRPTNAINPCYNTNPIYPQNSSGPGQVKCT